jgi:hypothetical protein
MENVVRIDIDPASCPEVRQELDQLGFRTDWIYQDLDHLSKRIVKERCR